MNTTDFASIDFFTDRSLYDNPYPYFEWLRSQGAVWREPFHDVVMVTGYDEAKVIYNDNATFSSCNAVSGPFPGFPVPLVGEDVTDLIEQHRDELPFSDQLPTFDPPKHQDHRGLLMRLITPKRLKENEAFMWRIADQQISEFIDNGACEWIAEYTSPVTLLVIADLLGVPEADHSEFQDELQSNRRARSAVGSSDGAAMAHKPLEFLYDRFTKYIEECRRTPREDVMTGLALATFPDGTLPNVVDAMRIAANLFAAGQETTARLLGNAFQFLGERPDIQIKLRDDRSLIPAFIEESLRVESPIKGDFRLSRVPSTIGGVELPAGTTVMLLNGAANRDPRMFENPSEFKLDRPNGRHHIGFGFGLHTCAGAPLARSEARITIERILDRIENIGINETEHGNANERHYTYAPTFMLRGVQNLHLTFDKIA